LALPVDPTLFSVGFFGPEAGLGLEMGQRANAAATETWARHPTEFPCSAVHPTAVLRRGAELEATPISARTIRLEGFVKSPLRVGVEVVAPQRSPIAVGRACVKPMRHRHRPIHFRALRTRGGVPQPRQRFAKPPEACGARSRIFLVDACGMILGRGQGVSCVAEQGHRLFVQAQDWMDRIIGFGLRVEAVFHARDQFRIGFRWEHPIRDHPFRHAVFLSVLRPVARLSEATTSRATRGSAHHGNVHLPSPARGGQAASLSTSLPLDHPGVAVSAGSLVSCAPAPVHTPRCPDAFASSRGCGRGNGRLRQDAHRFRKGQPHRLSARSGLDEPSATSP